MAHQPFLGWSVENGIANVVAKIATETGVLHIDRPPILARIPDIDILLTSIATFLVYFFEVDLVPCKNYAVIIQPVDPMPTTCLKP